MKRRYRYDGLDRAEILLLGILLLVAKVDHISLPLPTDLRSGSLLENHVGFEV